MTRRLPQSRMQDHIRRAYASHAWSAAAVRGGRPGLSLSGGQQEPVPPPPRDDPDEPAPIGEPPAPIPVPPAPDSPPMQLS